MGLRHGMLGSQFFWSLSYKKWLTLSFKGISCEMWGKELANQLPSCVLSSSEGNAGALSLECKEKHPLLNLTRRLAVLCTLTVYTMGILKPERSNLSRGVTQSAVWTTTCLLEAILFWRIGSNPFKLSTVFSFFKRQKELVNDTGRLTTPHNGPLSPGQVQGGPSPETHCRTKCAYLDRRQGSSSMQLGLDARQNQKRAAESRAVVVRNTAQTLEPEGTVYTLANQKFQGLNFSPFCEMEIKPSLGFFGD